MLTSRTHDKDIRHSQVDPTWVDIYGHMNMAVYVQLFDQLGHEILGGYGFGDAYTRRFDHGLFTVSADIRYLRELRADAPLTVELAIEQADDKRLWTRLWMKHATEGYLAATMAQVAVNASLLTRRATPFPHELQVALAAFRKVEQG